MPGMTAKYIHRVGAHILAIVLAVVCTSVNAELWNRTTVQLDDFSLGISPEPRNSSSVSRVEIHNGALNVQHKIVPKSKLGTHLHLVDKFDNHPVEINNITVYIEYESISKLPSTMALRIYKILQNAPHCYFELKG